MNFLNQWLSNINTHIQICENNKVLRVDKLKSMSKKEEYIVKNTACLNTGNYCVFKCSNVNNATTDFNLQRHVLKSFVLSK